MPKRKNITAPTRRATISGLATRRLEVGRILSEEDIPAIKGMLKRGDPQSDIAAYFGTNGGRISEINTGHSWASVRPLAQHRLPPPGPYMAARSAIKAKETLEAVHALIGDVLDLLDVWEVKR